MGVVVGERRLVPARATSVRHKLVLAFPDQRVFRSWQISALPPLSCVSGAINGGMARVQPPTEFRRPSLHALSGVVTREGSLTRRSLAAATHRCHQWAWQLHRER